MSDHIWNVPKNLNIESLSDIPLSSKLKEVLIRRGLTNPKAINNYLNPQPLPESAKHFPDLDKATNKIINSVKTCQSIAICGDYDADGMTSTALLVDVLSKIKGRPVPFIPSRQNEGYGLNISLVNKVAKAGIKLIITVDNGVSANRAIQHANNLGIELIITDHHKINCNLSNIFALIHPDTTPKDSPYRSIAGVGVTYILAESIANTFKGRDSLAIARDLLCIGTIADMASLTGANRYWLKKWIKNIQNTECIGLKGLMKNAKIYNKSITSHDIGFKIAPRINSIGRIDDPKLIIELLLEKDESKLSEKLSTCEEINKRRKFITSSVEKEALKIVTADNKYINSFILLAQPHWNPGVIGLVASRLMDKFNRPTAILTSDGEGNFRGSARSPKNFDIVEALNSCSDLLEQYGGHSAAAGFTVKARNLMKLENKLQSISNNWITNKENLFRLNPESNLSFNDINTKLLEDISKLEPFGINNSKPIFWSRGCEVLSSYYGYLDQLILKLYQCGKTIEAIKWGGIKDKSCLPKKIDIVFNIETKSTKKGIIPLLNIVDINKYSEEIQFKINKRKYRCMLDNNNTIIIRNQENDCIKYVLGNKEEYNKFTKSNGTYIKELIDISISILGVNINT